MALRELHRQRQALVRARLGVSNQISAICRRLTDGDKEEGRLLLSALRRRGNHPLVGVAAVSTSTLVQVERHIEDGQRQLEHLMTRSAMRLAVWPRVEATRGFGALSFATIIGETGDLSSYSSHSKVWKRLGLAVIDGERQRRVAGPARIAHGYDARRRSVSWAVGSCVMRAQSAWKDRTTGQPSRPAGAYRTGYDERKELELGRGLSKGHAHARAARYMEKRLIRNLWRAWRDTNGLIT